jgi:tight adherence protein C
MFLSLCVVACVVLMGMEWHFAAISSFVVPKFRRASRFRSSEFAMALEAADLCDFAVLALESGGNLEQAVNLGCCALTSPHGRKFALRLRGNLACGSNVIDALSAAAGDVGHAGGCEVARACALSARMGNGVSGALAQSAQSLRAYVATTLEERAARLPVLMLFPLVVFILPVIVLLLTGGAVVEFAKMLATA